MKLTNYLLAIIFFSFVFLTFAQPDQYLTWRQPHHDAQGTRYIQNDPSLGTLNCGNLTNDKEIAELASGSDFLPTILVKDKVIYVYRSDSSAFSGVFAYSMDRNYTLIAKWAGPQVATLRTMVAGDHFLYTLFADPPGLRLYRVLLNATVQTGNLIQFPYNQSDNVIDAEIAFEYIDGQGYIFIVTSYLVSAFKETPDLTTNITLAWQQDFSHLAGARLVGKPFIDTRESRVWVMDSAKQFHIIDIKNLETLDIFIPYGVHSIFGLSFPENKSSLHFHILNDTTWGYGTISNLTFGGNSKSDWIVVPTFNRTALVIDNNQVFSLPVPLTSVQGSSGDSNLFYYSTNDTLFAVNKTSPNDILWTYKVPGSDNFPAKDPILIRSDALLVISSNKSGYSFHELSQCVFGTCDSKGGILAPCTCSDEHYFGWACDTFCDPKLNCSGHGICNGLGSCACDGENKKFTIDLLFKFTYWTNTTCNQQKIRWESVGIVTGVCVVILIIIIVILVACVKCKRDSGYQQVPRPDY
eukprot:TRINITY_DN4762_c0_g2_i1.p1 TRINITY_DN4762_c0_g2~~TRINITY_DN4762_c0_g2_i1.p1  ORF type:complete len:525 (+),score=61.34 TRINITY_DN4762_c0_g2_i1:50-1624(+)